MAYCKYCGMESADQEKCEWCGRALTGAPARPAQPHAPLVRTTQDVIEELDEAARKSRGAFFVSCAVLTLVAASLILLFHWLWPWVTVGCLFAAGFMLGHYGIIPPFEDDWVDVSIPFVLIVFLPAFFVLLGYVAYGMINRDMNFTLVWLMGVFLGVVTILEVSTFIAVHSGAPSNILLKMSVVEGLGFGAAAAGWILSNSFGLNK